MSFRELLSAHIGGRGDRATLIALERRVELTGSELAQRIDAVAAELAAMGLRPGDRFGALLSDRLSLVLLYLAALRARLVVVPFSVTTPHDELEYASSVARPKCVLVEEQPSTRAPTAPTVAWSAEKALSLPYVKAAEPSYQADDLFSITFTSGTTARAKAVAHRAEGMLGNAHAFNRFMSIDADVRLMHVMPIYYMAGLLNTLLSPLLAGGAVVLGRAFTPQSALQLWRDIVDSRSNAFWLSPAMMHVATKIDRTADSTAYARDHLRLPMVGTAPLSQHIAAAFAERYGVEPLQSYGLSELLLLSADRPSEAVRGSVGKLLPEVQARVAEDGELLVSTPFAFAGYLDPDTGAAPTGAASEAQRIDFPTGDLAQLSADGRLSIVGRKKDIVIVGGVNVSPTAVEHRLAAHPAIEGAAVLGVPDAVYGEALVAFVKLAPAAPEAETLAAIRAYADQHLQEPARPKQYRAVASLPAGPTGKVQKHILRRELLA